jgi:hypothetical protein
MDNLEYDPILDHILELMKPISKVKAALSGVDDLVVTDSQVLYNGTELHGVLVDRILNNDNVNHLVAFLGKLMKNPSYRAVNELYGFLEKNKHAILSDGNFVAYKIVKADYTDLRTGTFDNSPGKTSSVPRNMVDEDANRTCSYGLHVCGFEYLDKYGSVRNGTDRVIAVSVNPANVVAVPVDYNNAKMRVSEHTSLTDITDKVKAGGLWVGCLGYDTYEYDDLTEDEWYSFSDYED